MNIIFETVFGSRLYGTSTPQSDYDYKGVYIPEPAEILMPKIPDVKTFNTGDSSSKNSSDDVDRELYSIHKFFDMLIKGDMNAYELLFAPHDGKNVTWNYITGMKNLMLTRQCRGFVGYVQRQAATYGVRGDRFNEVSSLVQLLDRSFSLEIDMNDKLQDVKNVEQRLSFFCSDKQFTEIEMISNQGKEVFHLVCCDRKIPLSITLKNAIDIYQRVLDNYGNRARAASTNEGVDWKAVSHAVRVGEQAIELLETGNITFPRPNAEQLLDIKQGRAVYADIAIYLDEILQKVEKLGEVSWLPEKPDIQFMNNLREEIYYETVQEWYR